MKKPNRWRPDTCGCEIEFEWDTDDDPKSRVHTILSHQPCEAHKAQDAVGLSLEEHAAHLDNTKKNKAVNAVRDKLGLTPDDPIAFAFDEKRNLSLVLPDSHKSFKDEVAKHLADSELADVTLS